MSWVVATGMRGSECGPGRCRVELHYGIVLGMLLLLLLAVRRLRRNWVEIHPPKQSHNAFRHNTDPVSTSKRPIERQTWLQKVYGGF